MSTPPVQRLGDALLLQGPAVESLYWVLNVAIAARRRAGRSVPPEVGHLAAQVTAAGRIAQAATGFGDDRRDTVGVDELAHLTGLSRRQARRIAATLGRLESGRWVVDTDTAHHYARSRTA
ncbi:hypothetical protein Rruber_01224 [Rhodococcus ruber]|uniref:hypothetical protein n=1 Tax=Rhodococcus ruber TaxID=1830 RepID=UPI00315C891C